MLKSEWATGEKLRKFIQRPEGCKTSRKMETEDKGAENREEWARPFKKGRSAEGGRNYHLLSEFISGAVIERGGFA